MLRRTFPVALLVFVSAGIAQQVLPERLQFLATHGLFERIRAASGFNLTKPATYGYFFNTPYPERLVQVRAVLENEGYVFVESHIDRNGRSWLQVAKVEIHTVDSMVERNRRLVAVASAHDSVDYDGWDVTRNEP